MRQGDRYGYIDSRTELEAPVPQRFIPQHGSVLDNPSRLQEYRRYFVT